MIKANLFKVGLLATMFLSSIVIIGIWYAFYQAEMFGGYNFFFKPDFGMPFEIFILPALSGLNIAFLIYFLKKPVRGPA